MGFFPSTVYVETMEITSWAPPLLCGIFSVHIIPSDIHTESNFFGFGEVSSTWNVPSWFPLCKLGNGARLLFLRNKFWLFLITHRKPTMRHLSMEQVFRFVKRKQVHMHNYWLGNTLLSINGPKDIQHLHKFGSHHWKVTVIESRDFSNQPISNNLAEKESPQLMLLILVLAGRKTNHKRIRKAATNIGSV